MRFLPLIASSLIEHVFVQRVMTTTHSLLVANCSTDATTVHTCGGHVAAAERDTRITSHIRKSQARETEM